MVIFIDQETIFTTYVKSIEQFVMYICPAYIKNN